MLTAGRRARDAVPAGGQGGIRFEEVSHNLCALHLQVVSTQAANKSQKDASRGADTFGLEFRHLLQLDNGMVACEHIRNELCTLRFDLTR